MILKHWIRNTVAETIVEDAVEILESNQEGVEKMVANNAFMIEEMKEKVKKEDRIEIVKNAIELGLDEESISKLTGLTIDQVSELRCANAPKASN